MKLNLRNFVQALGEISRRTLFAISGQSKFWSKLGIEMIGVDVGASYFPNPRWFHFLQLSGFEFVAIDPNDQNLEYLDSWRNNSRIRKVPAALSGSGGRKTLYITNVDSGSSLYKPVYEGSNEIRLGDGPRKYLFPFLEKEIETKTLIDAAALTVENRPICLKLDVQGAELDILKGASRLFSEKQVLFVEAEASLLTDPLMKGSTKFYQLDEFMRSKNYDLLDLKPIYTSGWKKKSVFKGNGVLNECDSVYVLNLQAILKMELNFRKAAFMGLVIYGFQDQAAALAKADLDLRIALQNIKTRNLFLNKIKNRLA